MKYMKVTKNSLMLWSQYTFIANKVWELQIYNLEIHSCTTAFGELKS